MFFCLALSLPYVPIAQSNKDALGDSLVHLLGRATADSTRLRIGLEIGKHYANKEPKITLKYSLEAEKLATALKKETEKAEAINQIGIAYFYIGLIEESARYRTRYLELKRKNGTDFEKAIAYNNLASIWILKEDFVRADSLQKKALSFLENIQDEATIPKSEKIQALAVLYNNMGVVYREMGQLDLATSYNEKGIELCRSNPSLKRDLIRLLFNHADVIARKGKHEEALSMLTAGLDSSIAIKDNSLIMACYYSKAKIFRESGDQNNVIKNAKLSLQIGQGLADASSVSSNADLIYKAYKATGQSDSALKYMAIKQEADSNLRLEKARDVLVRQEIRDEFSEKESNNKKQYNRNLFSWGAAALFLFIPAVFFTLKYFLNRRRFQMTHLEALRAKLDAEKLALEKELLATEIEQKEKKLATNVMYQLQKNEMIREVTQKLLALAKESHTGSSDEMHTIIKELEKATDHTIWEEFELRFQEVHRSFYEKLQQQFPDLSPNERRLCAFLRLNMSSKEISTITGQSIHSIQVARTRLRKKLHLTHSEQGLIEFIAGL